MYFVLFFRSLGVHISKVRSVTLDAWEPELILMMQQLGNDICNSIYEATLDTTADPVKRATSESHR